MDLFYNVSTLKSTVGVALPFMRQLGGFQADLGSIATAEENPFGDHCPPRHTPFALLPIENIRMI